MQEITSKRALLVVDYINEIIDPKGKLAGKGYAVFQERHGTLDKLANLIERERAARSTIMFVRLGFSRNYWEHPRESPLFGGAKKFGALQIGTWGTEFHPRVAPSETDVVLNKHRVSAFYGTALEIVLRRNQVTDLVIAGVATDLAVQAAVRDAHDRDFRVTVAAHCCTAASDADHESSLATLAKLATIAGE